MQALRRRHRPSEEQGARSLPWALHSLLRDGPMPLVTRAPVAADTLDVALVLPPGAAGPRDAGLPEELLRALARSRCVVQVVAHVEAPTAASADVVLAAGWDAAPTVLRLPGVRARAVLGTSDPPVLGHLGWTRGVPVLGPAWLGGRLPAAADAAFSPMAVHRRDDLVLAHGEHALGLLATVELLARRPDLSVATSGIPAGVQLPFPSIAVDGHPDQLAHAFASATVAFAPPISGWRPAAVAMLACGQAVVAAAGEPLATDVLGDAIAFAASPATAADAAESLIDDLGLRSGRVRAGFALVEGGWPRAATELAAQLWRLG